MELGIKSHKTRGCEVIKILESLGGHNILKLEGSADNYFYYITEDNFKYIANSYIGQDEIKGYEIFSLEDFLEKFPYKVGDKVNVWKYYLEGRSELEEGEIKSMRWNSARCEIAYRFKDITGEIYKNDIKGKVNDDEKNLFHTTDVYEEIVQKSFQAGYEKCKSEMNTNKQSECKKCGRVFGSVKCFDVDCPNNTPNYSEIDKQCFDEVHKRYSEITQVCLTGRGYTLPDGYHFTDENGNVIGAKKILMKKNTPTYPETNDEEQQIDPTVDYYEIMLNDLYDKIKECAIENIMDTLYKAGTTHEFLEKRGFILPDGYHFTDRNGNPIDTTEIRLVKNPPYYPKTYDECCDVLNIPNDERYIDIDVPLDYNKSLFALTRLLICRDAYWKIAGEWLELDKPWEPDFSDDSPKYNIFKYENEITLSDNNWSNRILVFPTIEMRNAFHENFKELIEQCKELL